MDSRLANAANALEQQDYQQALIHAKEAYAVKPNCPITKQILANALFSQGAFHQAIIISKDILKTDHLNTKAILILAKCCGHLRKTGVIPYFNTIKRYLISNLNAPDFTNKTSTLLEGLGFIKGSELRWMEAILTNIILPTMIQAANQNLAGQALYLENVVYNLHIKNQESEAIFKDFFDQIKLPFSDMGHRIQRTVEKNIEQVLPQIPAINLPYADTDLPVIAFLINNTHFLAHVEMMFNFLRAHNQLSKKIIRPVVIAESSDQNDSTLKKLQEINTSLVIIDKLFDLKKSNLYSCIKAIMRKNQWDTLVYVSACPTLHFKAAYRMAPIQIYWKMKYAAFHNDYIDGYIDNGHIGKKVDQLGRTWYGANHASEQWLIPSAKKDADTIRASLPYKTVYGTLARTEKYNDKKFLNIVVEVLKSNPSSCFIWAGREKNPIIQSFFERHNVDDRTIFIGWVNVDVFSQVLDIFLDTTPLGCGFTQLKALAGGKPVIFHRNDDLSYANFITNFAHYFNIEKSDFFIAFQQLFTRSTRQFIDLALQLADDKTLYESLSSSCQRIIQHLFCDMNGFATLNAANIVEIRQEHLQSK